MSRYSTKNPYGDVNWEKVKHIAGCTHMHCTSDRVLQKYLADGLGFATFSNYYPSAPYFPLDTIRENTFRCFQQGGYFQGKYHPEKLDVNQLIAQWQETLPESARSQLPFKEGKRLFSDLPIPEAPNAEHHWFSDVTFWLHICAPGALLTTGHFDRGHEFGMSEHGWQLGAPEPWRDAFGRLLDSLITPDGGGIVINHPTWSHLKRDFICELLDFDERVLGIEVYNHDSGGCFESFSEEIWDDILSTGRQCYGFFTQDHPTADGLWRGRIMLLAENPTMEDCLRAMRNGEFYGAISGNGLRFEYIRFDGKTLRAKCNRPVQFKLLCKSGVVDDVVNGTEFVYELPQNAAETMGFLRLTAREGNAEEKLFANAIMLA